MGNGYIKIVDRKKDMILVSGFNVYPNEIEEVVVDASGRSGMRGRRRSGRAFGRGGEAVRGQEGPGADRSGRQGHCAKGLTNYKRPKYIEFRDELPKTNVGKILRSELRG